MSPLLSVRDVAAFVGLSEYVVREAVRDGELAAMKIRGRIRIRQDDLMDWLDGSRIRVGEQRRRSTLTSPAPAPVQQVVVTAENVREIARRARAA
jgi:excisionase family DNA binding protein